MATLLFTAIGTAIGGPLGGAVGAFVGRQADNIIVGAGTREGPRLKELSVTTSTYGQSIPRNFGRVRTAGTIIWSTDLVETSAKQGGGKGRPSTTTYSYSVSFAVALSSTPIAGIGRIWADGNLLRGASGDLKADGDMRVYLGTGDNSVDPAISADKGVSAPAFRDCAHVVFENLQLSEYGNRIPALSFEIFADHDAAVTLDRLVPECISDSPQSKLQDARGFTDDGGAVGSSLSAINRVFPMDCVTQREGLRLSSASILPSEIPVLPEQLSDRDSEEASEQVTRREAAPGPEPLAIRYYDEQRDYQPGVQRAAGLRPNGREMMVDLPATMTAQGARRLANSNAYRARWRNEQVVWRIGELDPNVAPGSVVRLPNKTGNWKVRSWEWFDRGIELGLERLAPVLPETLSSDAGAANIPADLIATPSLLWAFELPPENGSSPTNPIVMAAASSSGAGWRGSALYAERAGTLEEIGVSAKDRAVAGELSAPVGASSGALLEPNAHLDVALAADDLAFDDTDVTGLAMGANRLLVGGEIIQFLSAQRLTETQWRLQGLLRARAGTEDVASEGHAAGTLVVLLDHRLTTIDPTLVEPGAGSRIAAIGRADQEPVFSSIHNAGLSQRPLMPMAPRSTRQADGEQTFCWTRRARGQWHWPDASEVPLVEEKEAYTVGYGSCENPAKAWLVTAASFSLSQSMRAELLAQHGSNALWVRQIGTFGQSSALLLATID
ncbi:hypothetical protein NAP1_12168 [Erythrobacter sp. NAP1]|uniref:phage tail protein n=1 Tax=Erythrobacter sp. NAP1 TaxID=237727 RepID=UPI00006878F6|nr:phage tail protein [Erythrobacter sp. NAP1]EAQ28351.1 hypothetical protein NAP1_12168 [Erythrobacter sp. NAP1]